jgi:hypothetical protein
MCVCVCVEVKDQMDEEKYSRRSSLNVMDEEGVRHVVQQEDIRRRQLERLLVCDGFCRSCSNNNSRSKQQNKMGNGKNIRLTLMCLLIVLLEVLILFHQHHQLSQARTTTTVTENYHVTSVLGTCQYTDWLDEQYRLSVCTSFNGLVIDIRQFFHAPDGLRPSISGINLSAHQWNRLLNQSAVVAQYISGDGDDNDDNNRYNISDDKEQLLVVV